MRALLIGFITLITINLNAQTLDTPQQAVTNLFVATDQHNWTLVEQIFNQEVVLDYSSMNSNPAATLTPQEITSVWKTILPGFEHTHHQIGNFIWEENGNKATVFCYGTATHYLIDEKGNTWTVVGSYDFELIKIDNEWKITSMKFNFKYQDGNTSLPQKAMNKLK